MLEHWSNVLVLVSSQAAPDPRHQKPQIGAGLGVNDECLNPSSDLCQWQWHKPLVLSRDGKALAYWANAKPIPRAPVQLRLQGSALPVVPAQIAAEHKNGPAIIQLWPVVFHMIKQLGAVAHAQPSLPAADSMA